MPDAVRAARDLGAHLGQLLLDLLRRPARVGPVEADTRGAILQSESAVQGGEVRRQSVHDAVALPRLHPLPALALAPFVQVRMTRLHLVEETFRDVAEVECTTLLGDDAVKEHLEQQVAELLAQQAVVARANRVVHFVRFLEQIGAQRLVRLRRVPLAATAQILHQLERLVAVPAFLASLSSRSYLVQSSHDSAPRRPMTRAWVEVDLAALRRNGAAVAARAGVPLLPMVKADAYGLGALHVALALEELSPWGFGVATTTEGEELRRGGITRPIVVFTPILRTEIDALRRADLTPALGDPAVIESWARTGRDWHLQIDTGMSRAGMRWDQVAQHRELLERTRPTGVFTHFHSADLDDDSRDQQEARFDEALALLPERPALVHAENGPAVEGRAPSRWTLCRPGIFLYGVATRAGSPLVPEPVASIRARIVELRTIGEGDTVSYGATWRAPGARTDRHGPGGVCRWISKISRQPGDRAPCAVGAFTSRDG